MRSKGEQAMPYSNIFFKHAPKNSPVAVIEGEDKFKALEESLEKSEFLKFLDRKCCETGKNKDNLNIAIKPNLMMFVSKAEMDVVTSPDLVEHLFGIIKEAGYKNVFLIESQNVYSNWYKNRSVNQVAKAAGYSLPFVDLSEASHVTINSPFMGKCRMSSALFDYDVLISFAKNKTHPVCLATLGIKNCFGLTYEVDKFSHYHGRSGASVNHALLAIITCKALPFVKNGGFFTIIDAWTTLDGFLGFKSAGWQINNPCRFLGYGSLLGTPIPFPRQIKLSLAARRKTGTIIAGENLPGVERVAMIKMGYDDKIRKFNFPYALLCKLFGEPSLDDIRIIRGENNKNGALEPYSDTGHVLHTVGYSNLIKTNLMNIIITCGAKAVEKLYLPLNLIGNYSPVDQNEFPKKPYWKLYGTERFCFALPSGYFLLLLKHTIGKLFRNLLLLPRKSTWRNIIFALKKN